MSPVRDKETIGSIIRGLALPFFVVDKDNKIIFFNEPLEKLTGYKEQEVLGKPCHEILRSDICKEHCPLKETMATGKDAVNMEMTIQNKNNHPIPVKITTSIVKDKEGKVIGGMESFRDISFIKALRKEIREKYTYYNIVSRNKKILEILEDLPDIAASDATVLIQGESGTGKELFANALHELSQRKDKPFIKVNCGALPETLLESELFGYKRGAFTDAKKDKPGRFQLAEGGTIFLDEIGEISKNIQVKLLRVLEKKEYEPLGSVQTEKANVRIITATNRNLRVLEQNGDFREDLYYRLNVITLNIPPLRERKEDVPLLIEHFMDSFNQTVEGKITGITTPAMKLLLSHGYPGNVRELENIIEHAFILCRENYIAPKHLPDYLTDRFPRPTERGKKLEELVDRFEKELIEETLKQYGGNIERVAEELGVHRSTLWRKMKKNNIKYSEVAGPG
ncbi:MAG TPA: sigma 54-interacting transcriptional regulator [Thermodesulfobacteriota bacterium]|nr:sigma 54-interacting transcriptional regulator [Thermodesulfobacteriota bacterium]